MQTFAFGEIVLYFETFKIIIYYRIIQNILYKYITIYITMTQ